MVGPLYSGFMKCDNTLNAMALQGGSRWQVTLCQLALIVFMVADMLVEQRWTVWATAAAMALFIAAEFRLAPLGIRRTAAVLVVITLALLPQLDEPLAALERGIRIGGLISSLLLAIALLSRAALRVARVREVVGALFKVPADRRFAALTVASQFFGGFLGLAGITMMMEMASQVPMDSQDEKLACYGAISRGYAAANLWSPMYSNVSILLAITPGLLWTTVFPAALLVALASLLLGLGLNRWVTRHDAKAPPGGLSFYALARPAWPIIVCMVLFLVIAVGASRTANVPVAAGIIVLAPIAAWGLNVALAGLAQGGRQLRADLGGLRSVVGEVMLFLASGCAGTVIANAMPTAWTAFIAAGLVSLPILACLFLTASVIVLSCTSVHPMLSGIVVATAFSASALALNPTVHVLAVLVGLGLAVIMTPFSVVSLMASRFSGVPLLTISVRANLGYAVLCAIFSSLILGGMNGWFQRY